MAASINPVPLAPVYLGSMAYILPDSPMDDEKFRALEKRVQELEYEKLLKPLETRVQGIEKILYVVATVALIFGAAGSWGLVALRDANRQLADLQNGAKTVQDARSAAIKAVNDEKNAQLTSFRARANGIAHEAVNGEVQVQISAVKKWTAFIYSNADTYKEGPFASGYWQKVLRDQNGLVQQELR